VAGPWIGFGPQLGRQVILVAIWTLVISGLNLSFGYAGEFAFGQAATFALGAYFTGLASAHGWDTLLILVCVAAAAALLGLISGSPGLRLGGWGLGMASFFLVIMIPSVIDIFITQTGGDAGLTGINAPDFFGHELSGNGYYVLVIVCAIAWLAILRNLVLSRYGGAVRTVRASTVLASSLGINSYGIRLGAYVLSAVPAGVAGCLFAYLDQYISPADFSFSVAIGFIAGSVLGGAESIYGAVIGAVIIQEGPTQSTVFQNWSLVAYGLLLVVFGVLLPGGAAGLLRRGTRRILALARKRGVQSPTVPGGAPGAAGQTPAPAGIGALGLGRLRGGTLTVDAVSKSFMGNRALDAVSLRAGPGQVIGLIGTNGSGKTTLLNIISGFLRPSGGSVALDGREISARSAFRIARAGIARTFQTPLIPSSLTTLEVVATARYSSRRVMLPEIVLRLPRFRRIEQAERSRAGELLQALNLGHLASEPAAQLPLGTRRLVEVVRALAADPAVVLFDEPASGLDTAEVENFKQVIAAIRGAGGTAILVEHNFRLICEVSDIVYVLESGRLIASGPPAEIQRNPEVARSYVGGATARLAGDGQAARDTETRKARA
jgi:branched-chain amino acid transport system permease protein